MPELGKLIGLSDLFAVTLDELVRGELPPVREEGQELGRASTWVWTGQKVTGLVLLCFGGLLFVLLSFLANILAGLLLALPFLGCGLLCLLVKRRVGLWCGWMCFGAADLYLRYATGISWSMVLLTPHFTADMNYLRLAIAWAEFLLLAVLILCTGRSFRDHKFSTHPDELWKYAATWGALIIDLAVQHMLSRYLTGLILENGGYRYDGLYTAAMAATDYIAVALVCLLLVDTMALLRAKGRKAET